MTHPITFDDSNFQYMMEAYKKFYKKFPSVSKDMTFTTFIFLYFRKAWELEKN
jgi:hypothetical protein